MAPGGSGSGRAALGWIMCVAEPHAWKTSAEPAKKGSAVPVKARGWTGND